MIRSVVRPVRLVACSVVVGVLAGLSSAAFLETLKWATEQRLAHGWLVALLPLGGLVVGLAYHLHGGRARGGTSLIIDEIHDPVAWVPRRMAPLVFAGTVVTHLVGGSAGREGTAVQMSGSLTDSFSRVFRVQPDDRRILLIAAIGGGFGAVFGVPVAGCVFAYEVQQRGRRHRDAIVPALAASFVGDRVVRWLGVQHTPLPELASLHMSFSLVGKVALAGVAFGLTSVVFIHSTHWLKRLFAAVLGWPPARPLVGGALLIALAAIVGNRDYLGLSLPLMTAATAGGAGVVAGAFALKLAFTALTLGSGFQGGEVTPLFVIGATLGVTMGRLLDVPIPLMAALGLVAVFAGAANTPIACTVMGVELFGDHAIVMFAIACLVSWACSTDRTIYHHAPRPVAAVP